MQPEPYHQRSYLHSNHFPPRETSPIETAQAVHLIAQNLQLIASMVDTIVSSLADTAPGDLREFRDISDKILDQFTRTLQSGGDYHHQSLLQYMVDLHALMQNLVRDSESRAIESGLMRRQVETLTSVLG
jgi:ElaB/YqjD/DUF883 family membrane-anchored ribosome-binding protein